MIEYKAYGADITNNAGSTVVQTFDGQNGTGAINAVTGYGVDCIVVVRDIDTFTKVAMTRVRCGINEGVLVFSAMDTVVGHADLLGINAVFALATVGGKLVLQLTGTGVAGHTLNWFTKSVILSDE